VPDANVAIVVSGSSATREYIQRLGRVLRPKPNGNNRALAQQGVRKPGALGRYGAGEALLYELISRKTTEGRSARARRPAETRVPLAA